jgi:predicted nucleotide-binding protein (sugar kinase/HSP70/actin superfamily)
MEEKGRIGIPRALMFYRYFPLWKVFFEELGWRVIVSDGLGKRGKIIYFEDSCLPMKLLVTHSIGLKDKVDHLFVPRLVSLHRSYIMCPKFRGAPDIVRLATERTVSILDETIDLRVREHSMLRSFLKTGKRLGATEKDGKRAFQKAERFFINFQKGWEDRINGLSTSQLFEIDIPTPQIKNFIQKVSPPLAPARRTGSLAGGGGEKGEGGYGRLFSPPPPPSPSPVKGEGKDIWKTSMRVAFIGHPYNLFDTDVNKDIFSFAKNLGMRIITPDALSEKEIGAQLSDLSKEIYWSSGREIVGSMFHFLSGRVDGVVFLTSFKCGIDALLQEFIRRRLKLKGGTSIPLLVLSLDEHSGREGLTTRLEAFRDVMEERTH